MKLLFVILFLIALFHLCVYYCNIDLYASFFPKKENEPVLNVALDSSLDSEINTGLIDAKMQLEKHLNELKQYDSLNKHG